MDTLTKLTTGWWPDATGTLVAPGTKDNVLEDIGVYIYEGLSVAAQYIMGDVQGGLAQRAAAGEKIGQDSPVRIQEGVVDPKTGKVVSGPGTVFGGNPMAHYGVCQRRMTTLILNSRSVGVPVVIWTAHEATNNPETDLNKELIVGPEVVGKQMTASVQRMFHNTVHCATAAKRVKQQDTFTGRSVDDLDIEYRLYTRDHFSASGTTLTRFKALTRHVDGTFPQYLVSETPGQTLLAYYEKLKEIEASKEAQVGASRAV